MTNMSARPVVGWTIYETEETAIILDLNTVGTQAELRGFMDGSFEPAHIHAVMTPEKCLELAEDLRRHAKAAMKDAKTQRARRH